MLKNNLTCQYLRNNTMFEMLQRMKMLQTISKPDNKIKVKQEQAIMNI